MCPRAIKTEHTREMHFFNMLKKATPEVFIIILIMEEKRNISMASGQNAFSLGELLKSCGIFFTTPGLAKEKRVLHYARGLNPNSAGIVPIGAKMATSHLDGCFDKCGLAPETFL